MKFILCACLLFSSSVFAQNKFDIQAPAGWARVDTNFGNLHVVLVRSVAVIDGFAPNVNIITEATQYDLDDYFKRSLESMDQYLKGYNLLGKGEGKQNGYDARWARYQADVGRATDGYLVVVLKEGAAYNITCTAPGGHYDELKASFEKILGSFSLN